jgi:hypothetical protein
MSLEPWVLNLATMTGVGVAQALALAAAALFAWFTYKAAGHEREAARLDPVIRETQALAQRSLFRRLPNLFRPQKPLPLAFRPQARRLGVRPRHRSREGR